jgi:phospholipid N-methyltransferase
MAGTLDELRLFFGEFRSAFDSTGAVLPSGRCLGRALTHFVRGNTSQGAGARRILEVGPGTGAVTREIIRAMRPDDRLELVELNQRFVEHLVRKLHDDARFASAADRVHITHAPVQELAADLRYNVVISGLPLNNFPPPLVVEILTKLRELLLPGGTLSFFEYMAIRRAKAAVSSRLERMRLAQINQILEGVLREHEIRRDRVLANVPPAWVHHLRYS